MIKIVMYKRKDCYLCDAAWLELTKAQEQYSFDLEQKYVDNVIKASWGIVPVVTIDDKVRFRGVVNPVLLRRILEASTKPIEKGILP